MGYIGYNNVFFLDIATRKQMPVGKLETVEETPLDYPPRNTFRHRFGHGNVIQTSRSETNLVGEPGTNVSKSSARIF